MRILLSLALYALFAADHAGATNSPASVKSHLEALAPADEIAIRTAYAAARHAFEFDGENYRAQNPGQRWLARFDGRGFVAQPQNADWEWGLELRSYGFPGSERAPTRAAAIAPAGNRLAYAWDAFLQEWFVNDDRGLEHGFTVHKRPEQASDGAADAPLTFDLAVRGGLVPSVRDDGHSVRFLDADGALALDYSGLKAWDADGRILDARFEPAEAGRVRLLVDERGARYPLTIDPIAQQARLRGANTVSLDNFGWSVAVDGDTIVVGAKDEDSAAAGVNATPDELAIDSGAAYVFVRSGSAWVQQAYLKASNPQVQDYFGHSVAISGDTIVIGAPEEDSGTTGVNTTPNESAHTSGAAYVFVRNGETWTQQAYLKASNTGVGDEFGQSVAIDGNTIVVGAWSEDSNARAINGDGANNSNTQAGAAYVFVRSGAAWTQQAYLKHSATTLQQRLGSSVGVSGDTIVVGAYGEDTSTGGINPTPNNDFNEAGAAFIFVRSGAAWTQQAFLKASNPGGGDRFGDAVAISGNTILVGAPYEDSGPVGIDGAPNEDAVWAGAAYVFVRNGATWTQQAFLKASNAQTDAFLGRYLALSGDLAVVGAYQEDSGSIGVNSVPDLTKTDAGAAYAFVRDGATWTQRDYLKASNVGVSYEFGNAIGVSGETIVVGAHWDIEYQGAVYVFGDATPLQAWRQIHFGRNDNAGDAANEYDFDKDGAENLIEYATRSDPTASGDATIVLGPVMDSGAEYLSALFFRDPARDDVVIRVEASSSLAGPWTTVASSVYGAATTGEGFVSEADLPFGLVAVTARDTTPFLSADPPSRFLRIAVEE